MEYENRIMTRAEIVHQMKTFGDLNVDDFLGSDVFAAFCKHMANEKHFLDGPTTVMRWYVFKDAWNSCADAMTKFINSKRQA